MIRKALCLLFALAFTRTIAQDPFFKQIQINRDNLNLGFNKIAFDKHRSLWIGTSEGLYNFNGLEYSLHQYNKAGGSQEVTAVYCDHEGQIWAGMKNGDIGLMKDTSLMPFMINGLMPKAAITSIYKDNEGVCWFATGGDGLYYTSGDSLIRITAETGITDDYIYIIKGYGGKMWLGTDQGITVIEKKGKDPAFSKIDVDDGLPDFIVRDIQADDKGNLWLALQDSGICIYNPAGKTVEVPEWSRNWKYGQVNSLFVDKGEVWLGTEGSGVICVKTKGNQLRVFKDYNDLKFTEVKHIVHDEEEHIWFTSQSGLIQSHGNWLTFINRIGDTRINFVHTVYCNSRNEILFTPDQGLSVISSGNAGFKIKNHTVTPFRDLIDIVSLYEDECNNVWIGTMGGGLFMMNASTEKVQKVHHPYLDDASILSIAGKGKDLWLGTFGGAFKCIVTSECNEAGKLNVQKMDEEILGNFYIYSILLDSRNRLWFGTDQKGLICLADEKYTAYTMKDGIKSNTVFSISEDDKGAIWFSTANEGICRYDGRAFRNYGTAQGLRELNVTALKSISGNRLIMVHRRGIDILHPSSGNIDYYGAPNNLADINPDINSIATDRQGRAWIGTEKGLVIYDPSLAGNPAAPSVYINRVSLFGAAGNLSDRNRFRHNENNLSIYFTGIWYTDPERVTYQYRLDGYNDSWISTRDGHVVFPNLPPGDYVFKVRAALNPGFHLNQTASYSFTVSKPFWRETWFLILAGILIISSAGWYIRQRDKRLKRIEALKKESVEYRFETLKSQVNPHFLFNSFNTLIAIIDTDKNVAIEYVEKLSDYFRNMIQHREKETILLKEELEMVRTYYYLQKKRFGNYLNLEINVNPELPESRKVPPLSLQLLIENAIKHNAVSKDTPLNVSIYQKGENKITVKNNINKKISKEVSTGIGLTNIVNRYKIIAREDVEINYNNEIFEVTLPLIY